MGSKRRTAAPANLIPSTSKGTNLRSGRHFCTLFDRNYIDRGLALHRSLLAHCADFTLHVLCLDASTLGALTALALPRTQLVSMDALVRADPDLEVCKSRKPAEFYFTCKPVLLRYLLDRNEGVSRLDYLDSDLYFFSEPSALEAEYAGSSVALSPHRFDAANADRTRYGRFNAGWVSIGSDGEARRFVEWWRERCIEWCSLTVEETRFGDQKYLDRVPALFRRTVVVSHPGANLAPWNIGGCRIEAAEGGVRVEGRPLVFFHFHGTKRMVFNLYESGLHDYGVALTSAIRQGIYRPYVAQLAACDRQLLGLPEAIRSNLVPPARRSPRKLARHLLNTARGLARQSTVFAVN
jgi:hypothetical protein